MIAVSFILIGLAAICNAVMDVTQFHYDNSSFSKLNKQWWDGTVSWKNKYIAGDPRQGRTKWFNGYFTKPVQITDAFHFFKTLMIIFICCAIAFFEPLPLYGETKSIIYYPLNILLLGITWNVTFSLFYKTIFRL